MKIVVIDGQGGRLGQTLAEQIRSNFPNVQLIAVGLNDSATKSMLKGGAQQAATGENAAIVACRYADILVAPLGVAVADSLLGEVSPAVANAVGASRAHRVLIPMNLCDTYVAGVTLTSSALIQDAMNHIKNILEEQNP